MSIFEMSGAEARLWIQDFMAFEPPPRSITVTLSLPLTMGAIGMFEAQAGERYAWKATPRDAHGNVAPLDGRATATVNDDSLATLEEVAEDGLSGVLVAGEVAGAEPVMLSIAGDARLGAGDRAVRRRRIHHHRLGRGSHREL